jgi:peptidoglycan/LPS O-acetylase OafA/YrhL
VLSQLLGLAEPQRYLPTFMTYLKSALTRETSGQKLIPQIDGLRFIAIVSVVAYHINSYVIEKSPFYDAATAESDWLCRFFAEGHTGVQLFFVISGFILAVPFAKHYIASGERVSLPRYFVRRIVRLEPPYIIAMTITLIALVVVKGVQLTELLPHYLASLFYVHYFVYGHGSDLIAAAWSLEIEVQFYFLAPLLAHVFMIPSARIRRIVLIVGILVCGLFQYGVDYPAHSPMHGWTILSSLHWFLSGLLLADFYVVGELNCSRKPYSWDLAGIAAWVAIWCVVFCRFHIHVLVPFLILCAYAAAFKGRFLRAALSMPWVFIFGGMCYTIYLYHSLVKAAVGQHTIRMQLGSTLGIEAIAQGLIISPFIALLCSLLFVVAEKPFMSRKMFQTVFNAVFRSQAQTANNQVVHGRSGGESTSQNESTPGTS